MAERTALKIDIIIPTYNRAYCLKRAIDSVYGQVYKDFKLIIVDDASTDNTSEILEEYKTRENFFIYNTKKNQGVSHARNLGIEKSSSSWIAFLDSDDEWLAHKLQEQVNYIKAHSNIKLVHGEEIWFRRGKRVNPKKIHQKSGGDIFERCLKLCLISPSAAMIKRNLLQEMGGFDEKFIVCEDYDLWLKITSQYEVGFIKTPILNKYGGHEDQLSARYFAMDYYRVRSIYQLIKTFKLSKSQRRHALNELLRKSKVLIQGYLKHDNIENLNEVRTMDSWALEQLTHEEENASEVENKF